MSEIKIFLPGGDIAKVSPDSNEGLGILRHSTSHIMAQAVQELFEEVKISIGPAIKDGFYYDFDFQGTFSPEDFFKIETRMQEIIKSDLAFIGEEVTKEEALKIFQDKGEIYKIELIRDIPDTKVTIYRQGSFIDLCRGPHIVSTGYVKAFKLISIAGAYWRGDEKNKMLQRIYGTAFPNKKALNSYLKRQEEAKKRDHRKLGKELGLFSIEEEAGSGLIIYHPKGAMLRTLLEDFEKREHLKRDYEIVVGPQLLKLDLWKKSGHFDNYRENMYFTEVEGQTYGLKPMNCLAHMLIYKSKIRSYRNLPLRYFELGTVHRHEKSGVLHGLFRTRQFTQDDAHILCTPEQLHSEIKGIIEFIVEIMDLFGFAYEIELSTRPEKSIGSDEDWERATAALKQALESSGITYDINEGDGAFYGPKIDVKLKDCLERSWQCATIQCDFTLPDRFDLNYVGKDGKEHRPVMLHRVILGSHERFMGILIEHFAGAFPVWLSPTQAIILTITDRQNEYAEEIYQIFKQSEIRVEKDLRNEKLGLKIREARLQKVPFLVILGDKEMEERTISVRKRGEKATEVMTVDKFGSLIKDEAQPKTHCFT